MESERQAERIPERLSEKDLSNNLPSNLKELTKVFEKNLETPDKLDKFLAGRNISLNCLISDKGVNDIFEVTIFNANNNRVSFLTEAIRTHHLDRFQDIDLTNLALYRIALIADSIIINSLRNISEFEVEGAIRMEPQDIIFTYFPIQP
ncbi:16101_t:CDS:2 [Funneliformis geosporum]|nr:16101_t:CDS:2 [Funneliformis geosporum]